MGSRRRRGPCKEALLRRRPREDRSPVGAANLARRQVHRRRRDTRGRREEQVVARAEPRRRRDGRHARPDARPQGRLPPALVPIRRPPRLPCGRRDGEGRQDADLRPPDGGRRGAEGHVRAWGRPALRVASRRQDDRIRRRGRTPEQGGDREGQRPLRGRERQPVRVRGVHARAHLARPGRRRRGEAADVGLVELARGAAAQPALVASLVVAGRQDPRVRPRRDAALGRQRRRDASVARR